MYEKVIYQVRAYMSTFNPMHAATQLPALVDRFGRRLDYLRISVTDRCDLRCSYCIPKGFSGFEEPENWLRFDEIERVVAAFARMGVARIRLTGGEPLLRRNLSQLAARIKAIPQVYDLSISTNATQLHKHAFALKQAGVDRVNVSLDSLDRACMEKITGRDSFASIMRGLMSAKEAGLTPIKLNMVVMQGVNDHEIDTMVNFCFEQGFVLRFIEAMPMGDTGRNAHYLPLGPIRERLVQHFQLQAIAEELGGGPARYWGREGGGATLGFITPMSQHFCATCNRVRMAVDGTLYMCLGQEEKFELRPLLRAGISDDELELSIREAIELKPAQHDFNHAREKIIRFMSQTGG
jgi:cyclic pyranopterin phosphate synthase